MKGPLPRPIQPSAQPEMRLAIGCLRKKCRWSQTQLAAVLGKSLSTVQRYEAGCQVPDIGILLVLREIAFKQEMLGSAEVFDTYMRVYLDQRMVWVNNLTPGFHK